MDVNHLTRNKMNGKQFIVTLVAIVFISCYIVYHLTKIM